MQTLVFYHKWRLLQLHIASTPASCNFKLLDDIIRLEVFMAVCVLILIFCIMTLSYKWV